MPRKKNPSKTYGQKIITLFAHLLFSNRQRSLTELAQMLDCSKQSVLRLIDDITLSYSVQIEEFYLGKQKYFRIKRPKTLLPLNLSKTEFSLLQMCHAFTRHLLGQEMFQQAATAIEKNTSQLMETTSKVSDNFSTITLGNIDYSGHHQIISDIISALDGRQVCRIHYKNIYESTTKSFFIKPLKLFSHQDTIYLHAKMAMAPGKPYQEPEFDPVLALHRIKAVEVTPRQYEFPANYNFEKMFNRHFGLIKQGNFRVTAEFTDWAAGYVSERTMSPDQKIIHREDGAVVITFSASSEPEVIKWILSFGKEARLLEPDYLVETIKDNISAMATAYK